MFGIRLTRFKSSRRSAKYVPNRPPHYIKIAPGTMQEQAVTLQRVITKHLPRCPPCQEWAEEYGHYWKNWVV